MDSLLNKSRPPVFCPGCSHDRAVFALDRALSELSISGERAVIVSDIGCSGLFDVFFHTHAFHGLHGRALTYAAGIKLARPDLCVIAVMGDGGMGIGGAHFLSACRRNLGMTLLVLNNFNYGMTGGQCSATTPQEARAGSGFLNRLEKPLDICLAAVSAGAAHALRVSSFDGGLHEKIKEAILFDGFSVLDIWGVCTGRYARRNKLSPKTIEENLARLPAVDDLAQRNRRPEYGRAYREEAAKAPPAKGPAVVEQVCSAPQKELQKIVILGDAGQRIVTAGELLCLAGASGGLHATQKNDYPITVMRGHSVSEVILSAAPVGYTGIGQPSIVVAIGQEGVNRRKKTVENLGPDALLFLAEGISAPETQAHVTKIDFKALNIKDPDRALAALAVLAKASRAICLEMLEAAISVRFKGETLQRAVSLVERVGD